MHIPSIAVIDEDSTVVELDTADAQALADQLTESQLATISALLSVAAQRVRDAQFLLEKKMRPQRQQMLSF